MVLMAPGLRSFSHAEDDKQTEVGLIRDLRVKKRTKRYEYLYSEAVYQPVCPDVGIPVSEREAILSANYSAHGRACHAGAM